MSTKEDEKIISAIGQMNDVGLFYGKMGVCLYFYISGRILGNKQYTKLADELLDDVYRRMPIKNMRFDNGLLGIGCAIEYLVQNKFVEGNTNDILQEIDIQLLKKLSDENNLRDLSLDGCAGYLCYLLCRLKNEVGDKKYKFLYRLNEELLYHLINNIEKSLFAEFASINKDITFDLFAALPLVIKLLKNAYDLGKYNDKIVKIVEQVLECLTTMLPSLYINRLYLAAVLLQYRGIVKSKQLNSYTNFLLQSVRYENLAYEVAGHNWSLRTGTTGEKYILWRLLKELPSESGYEVNIQKLYDSINKQQPLFAVDDNLSIEQIGISHGIIGVKLADYMMEGKI